MSSELGGDGDVLHLMLLSIPRISTGTKWDTEMVTCTVFPDSRCVGWMKEEEEEEEEEEVGLLSVAFFVIISP